MSDLMEDLVIKEEYAIQESNVDFDNLLLTHDPERKCGEIFLGNRGNFIFACAFCQQSFPDLLNFGQHIRDIHLLPDQLAFMSEDPIVNFLTTLLRSSADQFAVESDLYNREKETCKPVVPRKANAATQTLNTCEFELESKILEKHDRIEERFPASGDCKENDKLEPASDEASGQVRVDSVIGHNSSVQQFITFNSLVSNERGEALLTESNQSKTTPQQHDMGDRILGQVPSQAVYDSKKHYNEGVEERELLPALVFGETESSIKDDRAENLSSELNASKTDRKKSFQESQSEPPKRSDGKKPRDRFKEEKKNDTQAEKDPLSLDEEYKCVEGNASEFIELFLFPKEKRNNVAKDPLELGKTNNCGESKELENVSRHLIQDIGNRVLGQVPSQAVSDSKQHYNEEAEECGLPPAKDALALEENESCIKDNRRENDNLSSDSITHKSKSVKLGNDKYEWQVNSRGSNNTWKSCPESQSPSKRSDGKKRRGRVKEGKKDDMLAEKDPLALDEENECEEGNASEFIELCLFPKEKSNNVTSRNRQDERLRGRQENASHESEVKFSKRKKSTRKLEASCIKDTSKKDHADSKDSCKNSSSLTRRRSVRKTVKLSRESNSKHTAEKDPQEPEAGCEKDNQPKVAQESTAYILKREKSDCKSEKDSLKLKVKSSRRKNIRRSLKTVRHEVRAETEKKLKRRRAKLKSYETDSGESAQDKHESKRMKIVRKTYCCYSCSKTFFSFDSYRSHYRIDHPDMIHKDTTLESSNQTEFVTKIPEKMECKYCFKSFIEPTTFHKHMDNAHPDRMFICPHCPRTFHNWTARNLHVNAHKGEETHDCPECSKYFTTYKILQAHIRKIHLNIKPYACRLCKRRFAVRAMLEIHERVHTKEKPFQCAECGRAFIAKKQLNTHLLRHKDIRNYKCMHCDKAFYDSRLLSAHMTTHTNETPYCCDVCDKKFKSRASLHNHKFLHTNIKQYPCEKCGKKFRQYSGLYAHLKTHANKA